MFVNMYSEEIIDLYSERPYNGVLGLKTHEASHDNPVCGDRIHVELLIEDGVVKDARYTNRKGCFVTVISASLLMDKIRGMNIEDIKKLNKKDIDDLIGKEIIETRIKCELLPLEAVKKAVNRTSYI